MKEIPALVALSALLMLTSSVMSPATARAASQSTVPAAKVRSFEVLGIHLGMTPAQADAALAKHGYTLTSAGSTSPGDLSISSLCVNDYISRLRSGKPASAGYPLVGSDLDGKCVYRQSPAYHGDSFAGTHLVIMYCEDYPAHSGTMRAVQITYSTNSVRTDADAQAFRQAVFERMGTQPTWQSKDRKSGSYCSSLYFDSGPRIGTSPCGVDSLVGFGILGPGLQRVDAIEPEVTLDYSALGSLGLQDRDFMITRITAINKAIQATRSQSKTPF